MRRNAFTVIELIVVLFVLLVLAAILFPYFARSRDGHRRTPSGVCQSNLKQIGLGFKQYTQDYDEYYPVYNVKNVGVTVSGSFIVTHWVQSLQPYTKTAQIFQCPIESNHLGSDYYYNRVVSGHSERAFNNSGNTVLLTEGIDVTPCDAATATAPVTAGTPAAYARHLDGSNYAFVDGHVKWLQSSRAAANSGVAASGGGFTFGS